MEESSSAPWNRPRSIYEKKIKVQAKRLCKRFYNLAVKKIKTIKQFLKLLEIQSSKIRGKVIIVALPKLILVIFIITFYIHNFI